MLQETNEINKMLSNIPQKFLPTIYEYIKNIKERIEKGELSDTEYLENIPNMSESIVKESKTNIDKYTDKLDW